MVISLTAAKFKPCIFSMSGFTLSCASNMFILMILYDFCLLPAQFYYMIVYVRKVESHVQIADRCAPWKISNGAENLVCRHCNFKRQVSAIKVKSQSYFTTGGLSPISSSWCQAPSVSQPEIFFQLNLCGQSPYVTSSLMRRWVCSLVNKLGLLSSVHIAHIACY
jgi:hypothetical protein